MAALLTQIIDSEDEDDVSYGHYSASVVRSASVIASEIAEPPFTGFGSPPRRFSVGELDEFDGGNSISAPSSMAVPADFRLADVGRRGYRVMPQTRPPASETVQPTGVRTELLTLVVSRASRGGYTIRICVRMRWLQLICVALYRQRRGCGYDRM